MLDLSPNGNAENTRSDANGISPIKTPIGISPVLHTSPLNYKMIAALNRLDNRLKPVLKQEQLHLLLKALYDLLNEYNGKLNLDEYLDLRDYWRHLDSQYKSLRSQPAEVAVVDGNTPFEDPDAPVEVQVINGSASFGRDASVVAVAGGETSFHAPDLDTAVVHEAISAAMRPESPQNDAQSSSPSRPGDIKLSPGMESTLNVAFTGSPEAKVASQSLPPNVMGGEASFHISSPETTKLTTPQIAATTAAAPAVVDGDASFHASPTPADGDGASFHAPTPDVADGDEPFGESPDAVISIAPVRPPSPTKATEEKRLDSAATLSETEVNVADGDEPFEAPDELKLTASHQPAPPSPDNLITDQFTQPTDSDRFWRSWMFNLELLCQIDEQNTHEQKSIEALLKTIIPDVLEANKVALLLSAATEASRQYAEIITVDLAIFNNPKYLGNLSALIQSVAAKHKEITDTLKEHIDTLIIDENDELEKIYETIDAQSRLITAYRNALQQTAAALTDAGEDESKLLALYSRFEQAKSALSPDNDDESKILQWQMAQVREPLKLVEQKSLTVFARRFNLIELQNTSETRAEAIAAFTKCQREFLAYSNSIKTAKENHALISAIDRAQKQLAQKLEINATPEVNVTGASDAKADALDGPANPSASPTRSPAPTTATGMTIAAIAPASPPSKALDTAAAEAAAALAAAQSSSSAASPPPAATTTADTVRPPLPQSAPETLIPSVGPKPRSSSWLWTGLVLLGCAGAMIAFVDLFHISIAVAFAAVAGASGSVYLRTLIPSNQQKLMAVLGLVFLTLAAVGIAFVPAVGQVAAAVILFRTFSTVFAIIGASCLLSPLMSFVEARKGGNSGPAPAADAHSDKQAAAPAADSSGPAPQAIWQHAPAGGIPAGTAGNTAQFGALHTPPAPHPATDAPLDPATTAKAAADTSRSSVAPTAAA